MRIAGFVIWGFSGRSTASDVQAEEDPSVRGKMGFDLEESV